MDIDMTEELRREWRTHPIRIQGERNATVAQCKEGYKEGESQERNLFEGRKSEHKHIEAEEAHKNKCGIKDIKKDRIMWPIKLGCLV